MYFRFSRAPENAPSSLCGCVSVCTCGCPCEHFRSLKENALCALYWCSFLLMVLFSDSITRSHASCLPYERKTFALCSKTMIYLFQEFSRTWTSSGETVPKNICRSVHCSVFTVLTFRQWNIENKFNAWCAHTHTHARLAPESTRYTAAIIIMTSQPVACAILLVIFTCDNDRMANIFSLYI